MAGLRVAIEGCCHGELDAIYGTLQTLEKRDGRKIDLLICCGDFQTVRNMDDLECMACPPKYRHIQTFYKYYSGQAKAPIPTIFIGGNHEASNYLWELHYGGWVAPDIYYLGAAGVVSFGGLRIGGLSGTYAAHHYRQGHYERPPYTSSTMRSAYHIRSLDVYRLSCLAHGPHIMLSHDWPQGIARHGDLPGLLRRKAFLKSEIADNSLGSPPAAELLARLRPQHWFSAHMHTKFAALVRHPLPAPGVEGAAEDGTEPSSTTPSSTTRFLSLDKCLPRRQFLQVLDFPEARGEKTVSYDPEWAAVLRATEPLNNLTQAHTRLPAEPRPVTPAEVAAARDAICAASPTGSLLVPDNFRPTTEAHNPAVKRRGRMPSKPVRNPQTTEFLAMLGLPFNLDHEEGRAGPVLAPSPPPTPAQPNPEEIDIGEEEEEASDGSVVLRSDSLDAGEEMELDEEEQ